MIDFNIRNRRETEAETERIRSSQTAAERALEAREKSHRARVKGLEDQVQHKTVSFLSHSFRFELLDHNIERTTSSRNA